MKTSKGLLAVCALAAGIAAIYFVGTGAPGGAGLFAPAAKLVTPSHVAVDKAGNVYISDDNNATIDKLTPDGTLTIVAGMPGKPGVAEGKGREARLLGPAGIAVGQDGTLVVADQYNNVIYRVTPDGMATILAGTQWAPTIADVKATRETGKAPAKGYADGMGAGARFHSPLGVVIDSSGNTYVADQMNNVIRKITPAGEVTTVAGKPGEEGHEDGRGTAASFSFPAGVAVDAAGNLYVAETGNRTIRKITPDGTVSTLAGKAGEIGGADGKGAAARFSELRDIAIDKVGNLYVIDSRNHNIRKVTPEGEVLTIAGLSLVDFDLPTGIAVDGEGNLYVADMTLVRVTKISPSGQVTVVSPK